MTKLQQRIKALSIAGAILTDALERRKRKLASASRTNKSAGSAVMSLPPSKGKFLATILTGANERRLVSRSAPAKDFRKQLVIWKRELCHLLENLPGRVTTGQPKEQVAA